MSFNMPRIVISALSGGSGKTMISVGLARALTRRGYRVQTFKKGPDYIDTLWAALASGLPPRNLDPYMNGEVSLAELFAHACRNTGSNFYRDRLNHAGASPEGTDAFCPQPVSAASEAGKAALPDIAIIEGNRGLFDGLDLSGSCSTAELARQLKAPVLLTVNCTKMTRTTAALVKGCKHFEEGVNVAGVILNQASRERHREIVRRAVEELAGVPVFGAIPRLGQEPFEERHNGLLGEEAVLASARAFERLDKLADLIEAHVDLDGLVALAKSAPALELSDGTGEAGASGPVIVDGRRPPRPRIGYVRDAAFWFYYTENLEALERAGAELVPITLLGGGNGWTREKLESLDGLYIGAGFPEDYAERLSSNAEARAGVIALIEAGAPVYAEGSALYYLGRELKCSGQSYPMCGIFDLSAELGKTPRGIGYVQAVAEGDNPFHPRGCRLKAHEFHYASLHMPEALAKSALLRMEKGGGLAPGSATPHATGQGEAADGEGSTGAGSASSQGRDGLIHKNC